MEDFRSWEIKFWIKKRENYKYNDNVPHKSYRREKATYKPIERKETLQTTLPQRNQQRDYFLEKGHKTPYKNKQLERKVTLTQKRETVETNTIHPTHNSSPRKWKTKKMGGTQKREYFTQEGAHRQDKNTR